MSFRRRSAAALAAFSLCVWVSTTIPTRGQPPAAAAAFRKEAPRPGEAGVRVKEMYNGKRPVTQGPDVAQNRKDLQVVAKSLVFPVTHAEYYFPPEPKGELKPAPAGNSIQDRISDLDRYVLQPTVASKYNTDQVDYIREFGAALAESLKELNLNAPSTPDYIRVNGGRMLAVAAKSGAPALAPLVTDMLTSPNTRPELQNYALEAAKGLLAAYDPNKSDDANNKHAHLTTGADLYHLVKAVEEVVLRDKPYTRPAAPTAPPPPPPSAPKDAKDAKTKAVAGTDSPAAPKAPAPPAKAPAAAPPAAPGGRLVADPAPAMTKEQLQVFHYIRRAAIRALAQTRFPVITHPNGKDAARPLYTLAKVAVADATLTVLPAADEAAEAVVGLCNCQNLRGVNVDVQAHCVAIGVMIFAQPKTTNFEDNKMLPWRGYAARLGAALSLWQGVVQNSAATQKYIPIVGALVQIVRDRVLSPIERGSAAGQEAPTLEPVAGWRTQYPAASGQLYPDAPNLLLKPNPNRVIVDSPR